MGWLGAAGNQINERSTVYCISHTQVALQGKEDSSIYIDVIFIEVVYSPYNLDVRIVYTWCPALLPHSSW